MRSSQITTIQTLLATMQLYDKGLYMHSKRVASLSIRLAQSVGLHATDCKVIGMAALFHDIGKLTIPKTVLQKPGTLTPQEREIIDTHAQKSFEILTSLQLTGIYAVVPAIAAAHHMLCKDAPLEAQIITVADVFDAVTTKRVYHTPMPASNALRLLHAEEVTRFNPAVVQALEKEV